MNNHHVQKAFSIVRNSNNNDIDEIDDFITLDKMSELIRVSKNRVKQLFKCKKKSCHGGRNDNWIDKTRFPFIYEAPFVKDIDDDVFHNPEKLAYFAERFTEMNAFVKVGDGFSNTRTANWLKNRFYPLKTKFIICLIKSGYLVDCHYEVRHNVDKDDEVFYALQFNINGKDFYYHQQNSPKLTTILMQNNVTLSSTKDYSHEKIDDDFDEVLMEKYFFLLQYFILRFIDNQPDKWTNNNIH